MPSDFPVEEYEYVFAKAHEYVTSSATSFEQFGGAWNAIAYRFLAVTEYETALRVSLAAEISTTRPQDRYQQERDLFGFFSNGFSVFEASFYGLFSLASFVSPSLFPIELAKDQQKINPTSTAATMGRAFFGHPINEVIKEFLADPAYLEWREVRNILTHRAAPGRKFYVGIGDEDAPPSEWKIRNIPLNADMATARRGELSRLLRLLTRGIAEFSHTHL